MKRCGAPALPRFSGHANQLASGSGKVGGFELAAGAVADVEDFDAFLFPEDAVDYAVEVRFVAVEQMAQLSALAGDEAAVPFKGVAGMLGVDVRIEGGQVARDCRADGLN